jgi:ABC-type transport system substrate-binding protein
MVTTGQTIVFNTAKAPFDDVRVRKAFVQGIDWQALADTVFGEGAKASTNFTMEGTKWFAPDATLPEYDPDEAQRLIDEYVAEKGGPIAINYTAFQQSLDQARGEFIQTSLEQLENIDVNVAVADSATNIGNVLAGNYMVSSWGFPSVDMDPGLHNAAYSKSFTNYSKYVNTEVDAALDEARVMSDDDERLPIYQSVYEQLAEDIPFYPYVETTNGFVTAPHLHGAEVYYDGILRFDLLWTSK